MPLDLEQLESQIDAGVADVLERDAQRPKIFPPEGVMIFPAADDTALTQKGGPGSGNFGHAGRPGQIGGSGPGDGGPVAVSSDVGGGIGNQGAGLRLASQIAWFRAGDFARLDAQLKEQLGGIVVDDYGTGPVSRAQHAYVEAAVADAPDFIKQVLRAKTYQVEVVGGLGMGGLVTVGGKIVGQRGGLTNHRTGELKIFTEGSSPEGMYAVTTHELGHVGYDHLVTRAAVDPEVNAALKEYQAAVLKEGGISGYVNDYINRDVVAGKPRMIVNRTGLLTPVYAHEAFADQMKYRNSPLYREKMAHRESWRAFERLIDLGNRGAIPQSEAAGLTSRSAEEVIDIPMGDGRISRYILENGVLVAHEMIVPVPTQKWDEEAHPRDPAGTSTGGQFASAGGPVVAESGLDPRQGELFPRSRQDLLEVAAKRGREEVGKIAQQLIEEEKTLSGGGWNALDEEQQQEAQSSYEDAHLQDAIDKQEEEWRSNEEQGQRDHLGEDTQFATDYLTTRGVPEDIAKTIGDTEILRGKSATDIAELVVREAEDKDVPKDVIDKAVQQIADGQTFDGAVEDKVVAYMNDLEPSESDKEEWLQNAADQAGEDFAALDDEQKMEWSNEPTTVTAAEPDQWAVDRDAPGLDSSEAGQIRALGNELATQRSLDIAKARGLENVKAEHIEKLRDDLWGAWKGSSTSDGGLALQYLAEQELGSWSRLNDSQRAVAKQWLKGMTQDLFGQLGETSQADLEARAEGIGRAYVRGLWETTQYLMAESDVKSVELYRGLIRPGDEVDPEPFEPVPVPVAGATPRQHPHGGFVRLPELRLKQGSAASWTSKPSVANSWGGTGIPPPRPVRVVVRAKVPPTAVLAVPIYGVNLQHESEYVVLGTPWHHWDAWRDEAPAAGNVAIKVADEKPLNVPDKDGIREQTGAKKKGLVIDITEDDGWLKEPPKKPPTQKGGPTSGNYGHAGRPGMVGGSAPGDGGPAENLTVLTGAAPGEKVPPREHAILEKAKAAVILVPGADKYGKPILEDSVSLLPLPIQDLVGRYAHVIPGGDVRGIEQVEQKEPNSLPDDAGGVTPNSQRTMILAETTYTNPEIIAHELGHVILNTIADERPDLLTAFDEVSAQSEPLSDYAASNPIDIMQPVGKTIMSIAAHENFGEAMRLITEMAMHEIAHPPPEVDWNNPKQLVAAVRALDPNRPVWEAAANILEFALKYNPPPTPPLKLPLPNITLTPRKNPVHVARAETRTIDLVYPDGRISRYIIESDGTLTHVTILPTGAQKWDESQHPRDAAGTSTGGQFTSAGAAVASAGGEAAPGESPSPLPAMARQEMQGDLKALGVSQQQIDAVLFGVDEFARDANERFGKTMWTLTARKPFGDNPVIRLNATNGANFVMELDGKNLYMSYVAMPKVARTKGMGLEIIDNVKRMAAKGGFESVTADATSHADGSLIGAYVWSRLPGVKFMNPGERWKTLDKFSEYLGQYGEKMTLDRATAEPGDIANTLRGRSFLLGDVQYGARLAL